MSVQPKRSYNTDGRWPCSCQLWSMPQCPLTL